MLRLLFLVTVTSALSCELQPVQNLSKAHVGSSEVRVSWSAPSTADPSCVRGYSICLKQAYSFERCKTVLDAKINEYLFNDLNSCAQYKISVSVLGANNAVSKPVSLTASTAPDSVYHLNVTRKDNDNIVVNWSYDLDEGRSCAKQFQLSVCDINLRNCKNTNVAVGGSNYYTKDLNWKLDCNAYHVTIVALDSNQQTSDRYIADGAPRLTGVPENLRAVKSTSSSFDLEWKIPAALKDCQFYVWVDSKSFVGSNSFSSLTKLDSGATKDTETFFSPCTRYAVRVSFGTPGSENSASTTAYTLPEGNVFTSAKVMDRTATAMTVAVNTSLDYKQQCIAFYNVCWGAKNAAYLECRNVTFGENSITLTGLPNVDYQISFAALLSNGAEYDKVKLEVPLPSVNSGHSLFSSARVVDRTDSTVTVAVTTSSSNDQSIAFYNVCWGAKNAVDVECRNVTYGENYMTLTGLAANAEYQVSIAALLRTGAVYDKIILDVPSMKSGHSLFSSARVVDRTASTATVAVTTSSSNDQSIAFYNVCWGAKNAVDVECRNVTYGENYMTLTGLTANAEYQVSIAALLRTGAVYDKIILDVPSMKSGVAEFNQNSEVVVSTA